MGDRKEIQELEAQLAIDKQRYSEVQRLEAELLENIPTQGFSAFPKELKYRGEKEALENSIRVGEEMLAAERSQRNLSDDTREDHQGSSQVY
jgi:hypothetical protein